MNYILIAIIVGVVVAYLLYQNINHITNHLDSLEDKSFELYSEYSLFINGIIKKIKEDIESPTENSKYRLNMGVNPIIISDSLSALIRKLVFFETILAKQKSKEEIEGELFKVLSSLEKIILESFQNQKSLAEDLNGLFQYEFEVLQKKYKN